MHSYHHGNSWHGSLALLSLPQSLFRQAKNLATRMPSKWKAFTVPSALIYFMTHSCHSRKVGSKENGIYRVPGCHKKIKQENRQGLPEVYHQLHRDLVKSCHPTTHRHCWSFIRMSWLRDWHVLWKNWVSCFHGDDDKNKDDKMMTQSKDDGK